MTGEFKPNTISFYRFQVVSFSPYCFHWINGMTSPKPTILHVIDTTGPGGAETVFLNLADALRIDGYSTLALIQGPGWLQQQLQNRHIPFVIIAPSGWLSIGYYWAVYRLMKQHHVKFVQAHLLGSALTFALLHLVTAIPVVATLHGHVDVDPNERFVALKRWLLRRGLHRVVAVSRQLAEYLADRKLFGRHQLVVIHNGIDVAQYQVARSGRLQQELSLPAQAKLVGSIGNIRPAKDYPNLIQAAAVLLAHNLDVHFVIAGHPKEPLQSSLYALVSKLGIDKNIHFLGFMADTAEFLAQLDVFVLASKSEGFSISTLEAMAARVPIVATRCGGPEEILRPDIDGLLVETSCPRQLSSAIAQLLERSTTGPSSIGPFVASAYDRVTSDFSLTSMIEQYRAQIQTDMLNLR